MLKYLLDTDICIYVLKQKPGHLHDRFEAEDGRMAVSTITLTELMFGVENSQQRARNLLEVTGLIARLRLLDFPERAAIHAGQIRAALAKAGTPIGSLDVLIAGHARSDGLVVVTNNEKHFSRVPGLQIENWTR